mgnify:CR=1 FL=1
MKKIITVLGILFIGVISLSSCGNTETKASPKDLPNLGIFKVVSDEIPRAGAGKENYTIVYDTETKVMYVYGGYNNSSAMTPLYNADGSLKLYKEK